MHFVCFWLNTIYILSLRLFCTAWNSCVNESFQLELPLFRNVTDFTVVRFHYHNIHTHIHTHTHTHTNKQETERDRDTETDRQTEKSKWNRQLCENGSILIRRARPSNSKAGFSEQLTEAARCRGSSRVARHLRRHSPHRRHTDNAGQYIPRLGTASRLRSTRTRLNEEQNAFVITCIIHLHYHCINRLTIDL